MSSKETKFQKNQEEHNPQFEYASYTRRFLASVIDFFIISIILFVECLPVLYYANSLIQNAAFQYFIIFLNIALYYSLFTCSKYQATPGQVILKIKVVNITSHPISPKQSMIRATITMIVCTLILGCLSTFIVYTTGLLKQANLLNSSFKFFLSYAGGIFWLPLICMYIIFSIIDPFRTIYDRLTKTIVIKRGE